MRAAETGNEKRLAKQRKEDLTRLKRVEQIYVCATATSVRDVRE